MIFALPEVLNEENTGVGIEAVILQEEQGRRAHQSTVREESAVRWWRLGSRDGLEFKTKEMETDESRVELDSRLMAMGGPLGFSLSLPPSELEKTTHGPAFTLSGLACEEGKPS